MHRRPYGPSAWMVDGVDPPAWAAALQDRSIPGVIEVVPAASTVVVRCSRDAAAVVGAELDEVTPNDAEPARGDVIVVDAVYDGEDLSDVAERCSMSIDEVIDLHSSVTYRVAFCGFSPGFAYLEGLDERLHIERRPSPRTVVPAGSIAIAAGYSAVYPSTSPGGWHLIGTTSMPVWDLALTPPAVLQPGRSVRFQAVRRV